MALVNGKNMKVTLGANTVVGMGTWSINDGSVEEVDDTEFGDNFKTFVFGIHDGGTISFSGHHDPADTTAQELIRQAKNDDSAMNSIRLYVDNTSYYTANQTTSYWSPANTSAALLSFPATLYITGCELGGDKSGMGSISFEGKLSGGPMVLI